jgi:4'-phosphopantetheinyl transferase EntD
VSNPAKRSAIIGSLFPDAVVATELREDHDYACLLLLEEARCLGRASPKRVHEFAAGRLCARRALAEFGLPDFPVCVAHDRQPIWPATLVGSITHTEGFCAAVVAERERILTVGIDCERLNQVTPDIWNLLFVPEETNWLAALSLDNRDRAASLLFAAKEAFFKCQYPLSAQWLDFHDVRVSIQILRAARGEFAVSATRPVAIHKYARLPVRGLYRFDEGLVSAGVHLPAR